jgi:hypothetical protein
MSDSYSKGVYVGRLRSLRRILTEWQDLNEELSSEWARYYADDSQSAFGNNWRVKGSAREMRRILDKLIRRSQSV